MVILRPAAVDGVGRVPRTAADVAVAIAVDVDGAGAGVGTIVDGATCDSNGVTRRASSAVLDGAGAGAGAGTSGVDVDIALIAVGIVFVREAFSSSLILVPVSTQSTLELRIHRSLY